MAISIKDLIAKKDEIKKNKQAQYDLETSIGTVTVKQATQGLIAEALDLSDRKEADKYIVYNSIAAPDLKDKTLLDAYGCVEPLDIVNALFKSGEVGSISRKICEVSGYGSNIEAKVHEEVKN